jgi:hypothetical protein
VIQKVSAKFKSDEKALEIIRAARKAVGGDSKLREIKGLVIVGKSTITHKMGDVEKSAIGDTEIALQFPDKLMKTIKIGDGDGDGTKMRSMSQEITVVGKGDGNAAFTVSGKDGNFKTSDGHVFQVKKGDNGEFTTEDGKKIIVRTDEKVVNSGDGNNRILVRHPDEGGQWKTEDGKHFDVRLNKVDMAHHDAMRQNEFLRTTLGILLTAPDGLDVNYTYVGEGDIDGTSVSIVNAEFGGSNYKLYIGKGNNLPVALGYTGHPIPEIVQFNRKVEAPADGTKDVYIFKRHDEASPEKVQTDGSKDVVMFKRQDPSTMRGVESLVKFSDFRDAGGIQLPYKWATSIGDKVVDVFDVSSYDINPPNIAEKFAGQEVKLRMKKDGN